MHARLAALPLLLLPTLAGAQRAARDTARIAPVVVTATRSALATERAPASVTVLTGAQLRAEGITAVVDALRQVPGLSIASAGSYGGAASLFIRGGESKFTKVLIDGVPVNDAGGAFDFSTLTTDNIDRIEIVRGPASVLYGSDAVAGVIQLFTRRGTGGTHGELSARGGGFGTHDIEAAMRGAASGFDYSAGVGDHDTRGFQAFNSGSRARVGSALVGVTRASGDAHLSLRYRDSRFHYPTDGAGLVVDSNAARIEDRLSVGFDGGYRVAPPVEIRVALASHGVHGITDDQPDSPGDSLDYYFTTADRSYRRSGDVRVNAELPGAARLTVGGTIEGQWQATGTTSNFGDTPVDSQFRRTLGGYAQLLLTPVERVTVTLGGRYDHSQRFGDFGTWRAAGSVAAREGTRLRASVGTAFREPTFTENFGCCGFVRGNPDLSPEHGLSLDAGVEQDLGDALTLGATLFTNSFRDLIDYTSAGSGPNYVNVARTRTRGLELEGRATLPAGLHADASFTYLDARVADPGKGSGPTALFAADSRLLRRPMHTLDAGLGYRGPWFGLDLRALRVGTREDAYFAPDFSANRVTLPAYTRVDLSGEVTLVPGVAGRGTVVGTLRAENLRNAQYTETAGFNYDGSQGDMSNTGYRAAPRRVLAGVRVAF